MVTLLARLKAKPGKESALAAELAKIAKEVKEKEKGCTLYIPHVSIENPTEFIVFEKYIDKSDLDGHFETPHFKALVETFDELLAAPPVLEMLDEL